MVVLPTAHNLTFPAMCGPELVAIEDFYSMSGPYPAETFQLNWPQHSSMFDRHRSTAQRLCHANIHCCLINFDIVAGKTGPQQNVVVCRSEKHTIDDQYLVRSTSAIWIGCKYLHLSVDRSLLANMYYFCMDHLDMAQLVYDRHAGISVITRKIKFDHKILIKGFQIRTTCAKISCPCAAAGESAITPQTNMVTPVTIKTKESLFTQHNDVTTNGPIFKRKLIKNRNRKKYARYSSQTRTENKLIINRTLLLCTGFKLNWTFSLSARRLFGNLIESERKTVFRENRT